MQIKPNSPEQATFRDVLAATALHSYISFWGQLWPGVFR